jgi:hypothetical protein
MTSTDEELAPANEPRGWMLLAIFLAVGLIAFVYVWMTVHQRSGENLSRAGLPMHSHTVLTRWLEHGYFASHGLLWPVAGEKIIYRSGTGAYMISGFLVEKIWIALTGKYSWRLLALHNELVALLTSVLFALLAYRFARRFGIDTVRSIILAIAAQMVWFTFPDTLADYWGLSEQACFLPAAILFLLLEERALDGRRTRWITALQAMAVFAMTYIEYIAGTMFIAAYLASVLVERDERPPLKRLGVVLLLPWFFAFAIYGLQLNGARQERNRTGVKLVGSSFEYRSGLDGDAMFYGDHLEIAFGRDVVRAGRTDNRQYLFRWPWLFLAGLAAVIATCVAFIRRRVPRIVVVALFTLLGTWLLYAAVFSQAVALHPYHFDAMLATPLILALFAIVPALVESQTGRTGMIVLITLLAAVWLSMFQLRRYALCYPAPQPAAVLAAPKVQ